MVKKIEATKAKIPNIYQTGFRKKDNEKSIRVYHQVKSKPLQ